VLYSQRNIEVVDLKDMPFGLILRSAPKRLLLRLEPRFISASAAGGSAFFRAKLDVLERAVDSAEQSRRGTTNSQMRRIWENGYSSTSGTSCGRSGLSLIAREHLRMSKKS
jgi:hypothetical protein